MTEINTTDTQEVVTPTTSTNEDKGGKTFTQEEVNDLISKRINDINSKNKKHTEEEIKKAIAEYDRQAKLSQEEREKELRAKRESELKDRENSITLRERRLLAKEELSKNNIPVELVDFVVSLDEDKTKLNIEKLASIYNKSIEAGITNKLKGKAPKDFSTNNNNNITNSNNTFKRNGTTAF